MFVTDFGGEAERGGEGIEFVSSLSIFFIEKKKEEWGKKKPLS